ncbi:E3 ubiquitin-protein ligase RNF14-like [Symphorus nematophorus]
MNADKEEQEDELLALQSIFSSDEFVRDESKSSGEIRASVELPADFAVTLKEDETLTQYEISFLPPLRLTFELPEDYPSTSPPTFTLTCSWLTHTQLSALSAQLTDLYEATGGAVVLFTWIQFLKEDALRFLDIHALLELPSDKHSTQDYNQDSSHAAPSKPKNYEHTPESGPTENQSFSDPCVPDVSAPSLEVENPIVILEDGQNPSTARSPVALDSCNVDQNNSTSHISKVSQSDPNSESKADYQKSSNDTEQSSQATDATEAEQISQTSGLKPDNWNDLSSAAGTSEPLPVARSDQIGQEDFLNEGRVSASSSSDTLDESEPGAASLPTQPREPPPNQDQTVFGLSLTPSQILMSQLLIYDAEQKQKQFDTTLFDCGVCFISCLGLDCEQLHECGHIFCQACLAQIYKLQITEGTVQGVTCPEADCTATPTPAQVRSLVGEELFSRYDRLLLQNTLDCMSDVVYCPRHSCGSAVIRDKSSTAAMCSVCSFAFCVLCSKTYHGADDCQGKKNRKKQTEEDMEQDNVALPQSQEGLKALWDDYASGSKQRRRLLESRYSRGRLLFTVEEYLSEDWVALNTKNCPHCSRRIQKDGGCNKMTCSKCGQMFCWVCLAKLASCHTAAHFTENACSMYQYYPM